MGRKIISVLTVFFIFVIISCTTTGPADGNISDSSGTLTDNGNLYDSESVIKQDVLQVPVQGSAEEDSDLSKGETDINFDTVSAEDINTSAFVLSADISLDQIQDEFNEIIENRNRSRNYLKTAVEKLDSLFEVSEDMILTGLEWDKIASVSKLDNGNMYFGQVEAVNSFIPDGMGILIFPDDRTYIGSFKNSKRNGSGVMIWSTKEKYIGQWVEDNISGAGIAYLSSDDIWRGLFLLGTFWRGINRIENNGNVYYIEYDSNINTGRVFVVYSNGTYYLGNYNSSGSLSGTGIMLYSNGDIYSGQFRSGLKSGKGVYTYSNGDELNGNWLNDSFIGEN